MRESRFQWYVGFEWYFPESWWGPISGDDGYIVGVSDFECCGCEGSFVATVAELSDGNERVWFEVGKYVGHRCCWWKF